MTVETKLICVGDKSVATNQYHDPEERGSRSRLAD